MIRMVDYKLFRDSFVGKSGWLRFPHRSNDRGVTEINDKWHGIDESRFDSGIASFIIGSLESRRRDFWRSMHAASSRLLQPRSISFRTLLSIRSQT